MIHLLFETTDNGTSVNAGWLGGIFFLSMAIAVVLLWLNMNKRLKRIDAKYKSETEESPKS